MGTNFYARIIPKEDEKNELINKIVNNQFDEIVDLASELYGSRNEYTRKGNVIHLLRIGSFMSKSLMKLPLFYNIIK